MNHVLDLPFPNPRVRTRWATLRSVLFFSEDINPYMEVDVHRLGRWIYRINDRELAQLAMDTLASGDTLILYVCNHNMNMDVIGYELVVPNPDQTDRWLDITYSKARTGKLAGLMDMPTVDQWVSSGDVVH